MSYQKHITQLGGKLTNLTKTAKTTLIATPTPRRQSLGPLYNSVITRFYKNL